MVLIPGRALIKELPVVLIPGPLRHWSKELSMVLITGPDQEPSNKAPTVAVHCCCSLFRACQYHLLADIPHSVSLSLFLNILLFFFSFLEGKGGWGI